MKSKWRALFARPGEAAPTRSLLPVKQGKDRMSKAVTLRTCSVAGSYYMTASIVKPDQFSKLRNDAETRLSTGTAPRTNVWPPGLNALIQLYKLASNSESAADALKLLHELQVHQVELDLQQEQMEISQHEIAEELACYKGLYDFAAVGYFSIGSQGDVIDGNLCGAELLGVGQNKLRGHRIDSFLAPESRRCCRRC